MPQNLLSLHHFATKLLLLAPPCHVHGEAGLGGELQSTVDTPVVPGRPLLAGPLEVDPLLLLGGHLQAAVHTVPEGLLHSQEVLETGINTVKLCLFVCLSPVAAPPREWSGSSWRPAGPGRRGSGRPPPSSPSPSRCTRTGIWGRQCRDGQKLNNYLTAKKINISLKLTIPAHRLHSWAAASSHRTIWTSQIPLYMSIDCCPQWRN